MSNQIIHSTSQAVGVPESEASSAGGLPPPVTAGSPSSASDAALVRSSFRATAGVLLSRVSGLFRSPIVNAVFGASVALDAFYTAFRFPNALRDLFADGALSSAFTKGLVQATAAGEQATRKLVASVLGFFGCVTLAIAAVACVFAKPFVGSFTGGSFESSGGTELSVSLFRVLAFYLPLTMVSSVMMALLSVRGQTFRATVASAFANVGVIFGALVLSPIFAWLNQPPIYGMAVGMLFGGVLQVVYQAWPLARQGLLPWPTFRLWDVVDYAPLRNMALLMGPRILGQGAMILALLVNTHFATSLGVGAMTYITHAMVVILVPVGLFGVASGFASLPLLARAVEEHEPNTFARLLGQGTQNALWMALYTIGNFALVSVPLCLVLFSHGHARAQDAVQTAIAVCAYSIGVFFNSGSKVLLQGFYALGSTRWVVANAFVYLAINATASAQLAPRFGFVGLGLSNSLAACVDFTLNAVGLSVLARKGFGVQAMPLTRPLLSWGGGLLAFALGAGGIVLATHFGEIYGLALGAVQAATGVIGEPGVGGGPLENTQALALPGFWMSLVILTLTGFVTTVGFLGLVRVCGPEALRQVLEKLGNKVTKRVLARIKK